MKAPWSNVPLLVPATGLIVGIVMGYYLPWWMVSVPLIAVAVAIYRASTIATIASVTMFCGLILGGTVIPHQTDLNISGRSQLTYKAVVRKVKSSDIGSTLTLKITAMGAGADSLVGCRPVIAIVVLPDFEHTLAPHSSITFQAELENVDTRADLPDEETPGKSLVNNRIFCRAIISESDIINTTPPSLFWRWQAAVSYKLTDLIYRSGLSSGAAIFLNATIVGDTSMFDTELRDSFSHAGLAHILALSGMHVGLIAMIIAFALCPLTLRGHRKITAATTIIFLWTYAIITGLSSSVVRAVIMATIYLSARIAERQSAPMNSLLAAAMVILLFDPESLFEPGFQLSFAAVGSIILFASPLTFVSRRNRIAYTVNSYFAMSIAAMLGTGLLSMLYFHTFPVYFLLANAMVALLLPMTMTAGAIIIIFEAAGCHIPILITGVDSLYHVIELSATTIASLPGSFVSDIYIPAWIVAPLLVSLLLIRSSIEWKRMRYATAGGAALIISAVVATAAAVPPPSCPKAIYFTHGHSWTNIVITNPEDQSIYVITTAHNNLHEEVVADARRRYSKFMSRRGLRHIVVSSAPFNISGLNYSENILSFGKKKIAILSSDSILKNGEAKNADIAVVCGSIKKNIHDIISAINPKAVILSDDLNRRRAKRYADECRQLCIPVTDLAETAVAPILF